MFPAGWPGVALLLLRLAVAFTLMRGASELATVIQFPLALAILAPMATALGVGLMTPIVAILCAFVEGAAWHYLGGAVGAVHVCALLVAVAIAMLGPGAYSADARLFGRRKVVFSRRDRPEGD